MSYEAHIRPAMINALRDRMAGCELQGKRTKDESIKQACRDSYRSYRDELAKLESEEKDYQQHQEMLGSIWGEI